MKLSGDAQQLKEWVEKGVVDAVRERFLKKLYFGIAADPECTNILEVRGGWLRGGGRGVLD